MAGAVSGQELQTAEQIRQLTSEQATHHYPVHLKGVVTFYDENNFYRFFQDQTAGIYLQFDKTMDAPPLASGQLIEVTGETDPGEFAPVVVAHHITILGRSTNFPAAMPVTFEQITSGQKDSQFVEMRGIVRDAHYDATSGYYLVVITTGGGQLTAYARTLPVNRDDLVDSTVTVRGVMLTQFNWQRQLFDIRLLVPRPTDLMIDKAAPADPFAVPTQPIERLLQFTPQGPYGHRVKVTGTVIYRQDGNALYLEDATEGLYAETIQPGFLLPGDQVEVLGFPAKGEYTPMLQDAIFRKVGSGPVPVPDQISIDGALKGTHDCRLVRMEGVILDRARHSEEQFLVLQAPNGFIFHAYLEKDPGGRFPVFAKRHESGRHRSLFDRYRQFLAGRRKLAGKIIPHPVALRLGCVRLATAALVEPAKAALDDRHPVDGGAGGIRLGGHFAPARPNTNPHHPRKTPGRGRLERTI